MNVCMLILRKYWSLQIYMLTDNLLQLISLKFNKENSELTDFIYNKYYCKWRVLVTF